MCWTCCDAVVKYASKNPGVATAATPPCNPRTHVEVTPGLAVSMRVMRSCVMRPACKR